MSPRRIHRPSSQLIIRNSVGPPFAPRPGSSVPTRTDMSAARQWYKLEDVAAPLVNSGTRGVGLNLNYVAGDGAPTYGAVGGLFGPCLEMDSAKVHCIEWNRTDAADAPYFGNHVSIWVWHTPVDNGAGLSRKMWGRHGYFDSTVDFNLAINAAREVVGYVGYTSFSTAITTAAGIFTWGSPHLFAMTHDGATTRVYVDGVERAHYDNAEPVALSPTGGWALGVWNYTFRHSAGTYHDCGFDDTVFSPANILAMYHDGVP